MRTLKQQQRAAERERNRAHDARRAGVSLAHFPNGRDGLRRCYDCRDLLEPGEGVMQERGTGTLARKKLVHRDREACEASRQAWRNRHATPRVREEM